MQHMIPEHPASQLANVAVVVSIVLSLVFMAMVW